MSVNNDYSSLWNQQLLNNANSLLGSNSNVGPLSGDLLQQWAMRGANSAAYRKLLQAQETGTVKQEKHYTDLMSDKYFNDSFDASTGKLTKPTYTPDSASRPTVDSEATTADIVDSMRRLALAAINNPDSLNSTHYDLFNQMYEKIAGNLVKGTSTDDATEVVVEDATPGTVTKTTDFHLLTEDQNFTVAGSQGEKNYNFGVGTSLNEIVNAINADSAETGVKAEWSKNSEGKYEVVLTSTDTGKDSFVRVDQNVGALFTETGKSLSGKGTDALKEEAETVAKGEDTQAALAAGTYTGKLFGDQTFTVSGAKGSKQFSFAGGTSVEDVAEAINAAGLGVTAEVIYNDAGEAEGLGLLADKAGSGQFIQVTQDKGDLFTDEGKTVRVAGSSIDKNSEGPSINNLADLGQVTIDGKTYSFADIGPGGSASLAKNPDAALAVIDAALRDIYEGRAEVKGFDPDEYLKPDTAQTASKASTNALEYGNYGSDAMTKWIAQYMKQSAD